MSKVVLFGEGKIAEEVYYYFTNDSVFDVVAFCVDSAYLTKKELFGLPVVPFERVTELYPPESHKMFVALGYQQLNNLRKRKYFEVKEKGYELVSYICSRATNFGNVQVGDNTLVLEHSTIQPLSKIGNNVFIWSGNHVGHHAEIHDHTYVCGHVMIAGNAVIGENCFLGVSSTIGHNVEVGEGSLIGAGSMILKNAPEKSVFIQEGTAQYRLLADYYIKFGKLE